MEKEKMDKGMEDLVVLEEIFLNPIAIKIYSPDIHWDMEENHLMIQILFRICIKFIQLWDCCLHLINFTIKRRLIKSFQINIKRLLIVKISQAKGFLEGSSIWLIHMPLLIGQVIRDVKRATYWGRKSSKEYSKLSKI